MLELLTFLDALLIRVDVVVRGVLALTFQTSLEPGSKAFIVFFLF